VCPIGEVVSVVASSVGLITEIVVEQRLVGLNTEQFLSELELKHLLKRRRALNVNVWRISVAGRNIS
jgi:hypothetical protein